jgi:uncharacterized cupin superfamily protein
MQRINISSPTFDYDDDDLEGFRAGRCRLATHIGGTRTGVSVYEVPPGEAVCPYHYEYGEEEWLLVLEGHPTVRHPGGEDVLGPQDVVRFDEGPTGAHTVRNDSTETVRVLMFSNICLPGATVYPDSDKVGIWTGNKDDDALLPRSAKVDYYHGESRA